MKIAFVTCKFQYDDFYDVIANPVLENLGVEYIASLLRANGFTVDLYNQDLENLSDDHLITILTNSDYELIGFYTNCNNTTGTLSLLKKLPKNIHKCLGGYSATLFPKELIQKKNVDSIIMGEGELPFLELAQALQNEKDYSDIPNLITKDKTNPMRPLIDIDTLPNPARDELSKKYDNLDDELRWALVSSSRGCHFNCSFCYVSKYYRLAKGPGVRYRDPIKVVNEIEKLVKSDLKINAIWFVDEDFIGNNEERTRIIAEEIINRNLNITIEIDCRPDSINYDLFSLLKKAGLANVFIGVESFSQNLLNRLNKGVSVNQNIDALNILNDLDINYILGNIFFDDDTSIIELYDSLKTCRNFGFENLNDPIRIRKSYPAYNETYHHIPKDKKVRKIYKKMKKECNMVFDDFLRSGNTSHEKFKKLKKNLGEKLYQYVSDAIEKST